MGMGFLFFGTNLSSTMSNHTKTNNMQKAVMNRKNYHRHDWGGTLARQARAGHLL